MLGDGLTGPPNCRTIRHSQGASILQTSLSAVLWTDFRHANPRNLRGNFGERNLGGKTKDCVAPGRIRTRGPVGKIWL